MVVCFLSRKHSVNRSSVPDEDVTDASSEKDKLTLEEIINIKLVESGERENLMELVRDRLVESGWKDEMRVACREHVKKKGRKDVTVDELIRVITPKGRERYTNPFGMKPEQRNLR
uniref:Transcription and mRNA export factor ENY2 n=2 Tax=Brassica campestris TaxID=3711 RepID=M4E8Z3_BRACM